MKIIENTEYIEFREVELGGVFRSAGEIFIRTDDNLTDFGNMNAANLKSGITAGFCPDDMVVPLTRAHVVIE